jgi:hypothetical protein
MIKAQYTDRKALEAELVAAMKEPRKAFPLKLSEDETIEFYPQLLTGNTISGKTADVIGALVTIDLDTLEVTLT